MNYIRTLPSEQADSVQYLSIIY